MKIAFLTKVVPPAIDGIGEYTVNLVSALRDLKVDAQIFTSLEQKASESWIHPVIKEWNGGQIAADLRSFNPDWCIFQYSPLLYGRYGLCWTAAGIPGILKKELGVKTAATFHEFQTAWSVEPKKLFLAAALRLQTLRLLRGCDAAITTCAIYAEILQGYRRTLPLAAIPVSGNIPPLKHPAEEIAFLKKKHAITNEKIITVFGRLSGFRNYKTAVRVLGEAKQKGIPAKLLFLGGMRSSSPELFQELSELARKLGVENNTIETGDLPAESVSAYLEISDLFLFPQQDGISTRNTGVLSALAHGLPVVTYEPRPGNFDGYTLPHTALIRTGHEEAFIAESLKMLSENLKARGAAEIKTYFQKHFSWHHLAGLYLKTLAAPV